MEQRALLFVAVAVELFGRDDDGDGDASFVFTSRCLSLAWHRLAP